VRVAAVSSFGGWQALAVLPAAHALARGSSLGLLGVAPPATDTGLGASYAAHVTRRRLAGVGGVSIAMAAAAAGLWALPAVILALLGAGVAGVVAVRRIGGITGDALGAAEQLAETLVLLFGAAVVAHHGAGLPWWR
jgi:adenosylcobinamide-GDP ribazoletransferase